MNAGLTAVSLMPRIALVAAPSGARSMPRITKAEKAKNTPATRPVPTHATTSMTFTSEPPRRARERIVVAMRPGWPPTPGVSMAAHR